jgi:photosystem II stability/assembly factor-like uncharacterized protein
MRLQRSRSGVAALAAALLAMLSSPLVLADEKVAPLPATAPATDSADADAAKLRVERALPELQRKSGRAPKAQRDARTIAWQQGRNAPGAAFDQPQSAQTHFLARRLPPGEVTLDPARYAGALRHAAAMPAFSVRQMRMLPPSAAAPAGIVSRSIAQRTSRTAPSIGFGSVPSIASSTTGALAGDWEDLGPGNIGGRTRALVIHPVQTDTMWAGSVAGGIWKTTDGGATWVPKADLLINMAVNTLALDPRNPDVLYAGTGEGFFNGDAVRGAGILKSDDGGETWTPLASTVDNADFHYVQKVVVSRNNTQRVYAATRTGVFRSVDGGTTWAKMIDATLVNGCMDLAIQTDRALAYVFASCGTFAQGRIQRAIDTSSAQTWTTVMSVPNQGRTSLAIAPSNQSIIYALAASTAAGPFLDGLLGVYRSSANGNAGSWQTRVSNTSPTTLNTLLLSNPVIAVLTQCGFGTSSFLNQGWYDNAIAVDPKNPDVVWVGGIDLFRSDDGGQNFGQASHWWFNRGVDPEYNHADHHLLVFHPNYDGTTNRVMFSTNDGGIFKTVNARAPVAYSPNPINASSPICGAVAPGGLAWTELNNGYQVTQFYHGAHYPNGNTVFGGTQDNGTLRGTAATPPTPWETILGGDGGYVAVNPANTSMLWASNTGLSFQRSTNGGSTWQNVTSGITESVGNFAFIAATALWTSPVAPGTSVFWSGGARAWRASNPTAVPAPNPYWANASQFFGARVSAIGVAPSDGNRVYMGTASTGRVFTTTVALAATSATVWPSAVVRPNATISSVAVHPTNPSIAYATVSTFNSATSIGHVFRTTDGGVTWANVDGSGATGIPDVPAHTIVVDPNDTNRLYVGTDIGVFVSIDGGANWARENSGFANVIVEALTLKNTAPRYLYAFTHGRSAWRVPLP